MVRLSYTSGLKETLRSEESPPLLNAEVIRPNYTATFSLNLSRNKVATSMLQAAGACCAE